MTDGESNQMLREVCAIVAMHGLSSSLHARDGDVSIGYQPGTINYEAVAADAVRLADALMLELEKPPHRHGEP
jgi:hypothetical protein